MRDNARSVNSSTPTSSFWNHRKQRAVWLVLGATLLLSLVSRSAVALPEFGADCTVCHGPQLSTMPADGEALDFGATLVGQSTDKELAITNTGGASGGRAKSLSGDFPESQGRFVLDGDTRFSNLARNATASRVYQYAPTRRGLDSEVMTATADNSDNLPVSGSTVTFTGQGVAPVSSVDASGAELGNVRIGASAGAQIVIDNMGDGNLSGQAAASNLNGTASAGAGDYSGPGGNVSLGDGLGQTFSYLFAPSSRGPQPMEITFDMTNGAPEGTMNLTRFLFYSRAAGWGRSSAAACRPGRSSISATPPRSS